MNRATPKSIRAYRFRERPADKDHVVRLDREAVGNPGERLVCELPVEEVGIERPVGQETHQVDVVARYASVVSAHEDASIGLDGDAGGMIATVSPVVRHLAALVEAGIHRAIAGEADHAEGIMAGAGLDGTGGDDAAVVADGQAAGIGRGHGQAGGDPAADTKARIERSIGKIPRDAQVRTVSGSDVAGHHDLAVGLDGHPLGRKTVAGERRSCRVEVRDEAWIEGTVAQVTEHGKLAPSRQSGDDDIALGADRLNGHGLRDGQGAGVECRFVRSAIGIVAGHERGTAGGLAMPPGKYFDARDIHAFYPNRPSLSSPFVSRPLIILPGFGGWHLYLLYLPEAVAVSVFLVTRGAVAFLVVGVVV